MDDVRAILETEAKVDAGESVPYHPGTAGVRDSAWMNVSRSARN
jgi:hypothetical protein